MQYIQMESLQIMSSGYAHAVILKLQRKRCGYVWGYIQVNGIGESYKGNFSYTCNYLFSQKRTICGKLYQNINIH